MRAINIAKTQAKGLIKMMFNAGAIKTEQRGEMIRGLNGFYSRKFYELDGEFICIKGSKKAVDTIKI